MKLLLDLEKTAAISLVPKKKKANIRKRKVLTKEEIVKRALESERDIQEKNYISLEDLEKEMKSW